MPMFYTPKPRQFHYKPRFYDPEKERWEALKQKYADEKALEELRAATVETCNDTPQQDGDDVDLAYFQQRVRELDRKEKHKGLTWKDMFRKREMPKFNYTPQFSEGVKGSEEGVKWSEMTNVGTGEHIAEFKKRGVKIKRRFDVTDPDYMKPMPAGRIMLYALLVCMLLYWILF